MESKQIVVGIILLCLIISVSSVSANPYGTGHYGCGFYGVGCPNQLSGGGGIPPTPFEFDITPENILSPLVLGHELDDTINVVNATTYDFLIAEFVCLDDNSCNWAKFLVGGEPYEDNSYKFHIGPGDNKTVDFVVNVPIDAEDIKYEFNVSFSDIYNNTVKSSNYVIEAEEFIWWDEFFGFSILGNLSGGVIVWSSIISVIIVLLMLLYYRKKKKRKRMYSEDDENDYEESAEEEDEL